MLTITAFTQPYYELHSIEQNLKKDTEIYSDIIPFTPALELDPHHNGFSLINIMQLLEAKQLTSLLKID
jgi:hypothetical protein